MPFSLPRLILWGTALQLSFGAAAVWAWRASGNPGWLDVYFHGPGGLFLVAISALGLWAAVKCFQQFSPGDMMRPAWMLISVAAGCHLMGAVMSEVLGVHSFLNPLTWSGVPTDIAVQGFRRFGHSVGGPLRLALLACGLVFVVRVYRHAGLLSRLAASDWALVTVLAAYIGTEGWAVAVAWRSGTAFSAFEKVNWFNDPLLLVLLMEAILIHRSLLGMGWGLVARCWGAFVAGIVLTLGGRLSSASERLRFASVAGERRGMAYLVRGRRRPCSWPGLPIAGRRAP